jgi:RHS repeat-associated protein
LRAINDPGLDGVSTTSPAALDVMGYSLHYFTGDYTPIGGSSTFIATQTGSDLENTSYSKDMFNGNIARMVTTITDPNSRTVLPLGNTYRYDQLNRLLTSRSFDNITLSTNSWGSGGTARYRNDFTYDANGNIKTQRREDYSAALIDSLRYFYDKTGGETMRNRLYHVDDYVSAGTYADDIDDMGAFVSGANINTSNNYAYDAEGRLIKDVQEGIASIEWRVDGKVKKINRTSGSSKKNVSFDYDAMGHRVAKHQYSSSNVLEKSIYYILDAQGNIISSYVREIISSTVYYSQKEKFIFGSTTLGVLNDSIPLYASQNSTYSQTTWTHAIGKRNYSLSEHRNNVLAVISDKPILHGTGGATTPGTVVDYFMADILQTSDYTPFGVTIPERNLKKSVSGVRDYAMGFQGQLEDDEIKAEGNSLNYEYRMHDPRLGRFFAIDPLTPKYPFYSPYQFSGNRVIDAIELEGLEPDLTGDEEPGDIKLAAEDGTENIFYWLYEQCDVSSNCGIYVKGEPYTHPSARENAEISNHVYSVFNSSVKIGDNAPYTDYKLVNRGFTLDGYKEALYKRTIDGVDFYVLAFAGTDDLNDAIEDACAGTSTGVLLNQLPIAKGEALWISDWIESLGGNLSFTGHSLGGGEAAVASGATGKYACTFNAMGVSEKLQAELGCVISNSMIDAYIIKGDAVDAVQSETANGMQHMVNPATTQFIGSNPITAAINNMIYLHLMDRFLEIYRKPK